MFCIACGKQIADSAKFCGHCGSSVVPKAAGLAADAATRADASASPPSTVSGSRASAYDYSILAVVAGIVAVGVIAVILLRGRPVPSGQSGADADAAGQPGAVSSVSDAVSSAVSRLTGNQLDRARAATLIASSKSFAPVAQIQIDAASLSQGQSRALWSTINHVRTDALDPIPATTANWVLTQAGETAFSSMQSEFNPGGTSRTAVLGLRQPAERQVIEINGIRGGQSNDSAAEAEFTWQLPIAAGTFTGSASFQKFDDGWRVQGVAAELPQVVTLRFDKLPQPSAAVIAAVHQAQEDAVRKENEARQENARRAAREQIAKTPTRQLATFEFVRRERNGFGQPTDYTTRLEITDATVTVTFSDKTSVALGFWQIERVDLDPNNGNGLTIWYQCAFCHPYNLGPDTSDSTKSQRAMNEINRGRAAWDRRFPDRVTWIATGESTIAPLVEGQTGVGGPAKGAVSELAAPRLEQVSLSIDQALLAQSVENGTPSGISDRFPVDIARIVCYVVVSRERAGQVIKFVWIQPNGQQSIQSSSSLSRPMVGHPQFASSTFIRRTALQAGRWRVDIYVDGALAKYVYFTLS